MQAPPLFELILFALSFVKTANYSDVSFSSPSMCWNNTNEFKKTMRRECLIFQDINGTRLINGFLNLMWQFHVFILYFYNVIPWRLMSIAFINHCIIKLYNYDQFILLTWNSIRKSSMICYIVIIYECRVYIYHRLYNILFSTSIIDEMINN